MTYTPKEWQCDDFITAGELNRMERGIQEAIGVIPTRVITKDDFVVIDFFQTMTARQSYTEFSEELPSEIDDVDNYALISAMVYEEGRTTASEGNKWVNIYHINTYNSSDELVGVKIIQNVMLYNENGVSKIRYGLISYINHESVVTLRIVLMKLPTDED